MSNVFVCQPTKKKRNHVMFMRVKRNPMLVYIYLNKVNKILLPHFHIICAIFIKVKLKEN